MADWLMFFAVLAGPMISVQLARFLDEQREVPDRKMSAFKPWGGEGR
jgi:hypothetical protein